MLAGPTQSPWSSMRLEAAARMDVFRKLWAARKLIVVVFIPLSLLPLPLIHPTSVSTSTIQCKNYYNQKMFQKSTLQLRGRLLINYDVFN